MELREKNFFFLNYMVDVMLNIGHILKYFVHDMVEIIFFIIIIYKIFIG